MNVLKKASKLNLFWRKVILFAILFVLAVPLLVLALRNFSARTRSFNGGVLLENFNISEMQEELGQSFLQIQETKQALQEQMEGALETATTSTSTDALATTTAD